MTTKVSCGIISLKESSFRKTLLKMINKIKKTAQTSIICLGIDNISNFIDIHWKFNWFLLQCKEQ